MSLTAAGTVSATNQAKWHRKSGAEERGSSPPPPPPPSPSGGVCWVRSRQFGLNNHRPFLHQRRPLAPSCHAHRYGDLKMAGMLMQIALIVRRSFSVDSFERLWWLMTAFVARYRMDGAILSTIPLKRQLCGNQRCCCCPSTFFVSLCDAARQSIASRSYARPSVRQGENLSSFLQGGGRERRAAHSFAFRPSLSPSLPILIPRGHRPS